jgi:hypothetical protein
MDPGLDPLLPEVVAGGQCPAADPLPVAVLLPVQLPQLHLQAPAAAVIVEVAGSLAAGVVAQVLLGCPPEDPSWRRHQVVTAAQPARLPGVAPLAVAGYQDLLHVCAAGEVDVHLAQGVLWKAVTLARHAVGVDARGGADGVWCDGGLLWDDAHVD